MNQTIPDNLDAYNYFENERERIKRIHKKQAEEGWIDISELPFYEEPDTYESEEDLYED